MSAQPLRVVVVTQDDPFYLPIFFRAFFEKIEETIDPVAVVRLAPFDESMVDLVRRMYRLYGPATFLRRGVEFTCRKALDALGARAYSVKSVARGYQIPVRSETSVNTEDFVRWVQAKEADLILSVAAPEIFGPEVLDAPSWGCLNVHTAELPKYRGMLPTFWALYHEEDEVGVTIHTMEPEIDRGRIAAQTTFPVQDGDTLDAVIERGKHVGGRLAATALQDLRLGELDLKPMEGEESYFSFPTVEERRELQEKGRALI